MDSWRVSPPSTICRLRGAPSAACRAGRHRARCVGRTSGCTATITCTDIWAVATRCSRSTLCTSSGLPESGSQAFGVGPPKREPRPAASSNMAIFTPRDLTLSTVAVVRILGIDPGTLVAGFGCLEMVVEGPKRSRGEVPLALQVSNVVRLGGGAGDVRLVDMGVMRLGGRDAPLPERLLALSQQLRC